jgi:ribosomal protein S18 acetylase RimI-like enzyme
MEIGTIWTSIREEGAERTAFIEEVEISPSERGAGYGARTIKALGNESYGATVDVVSLFVQPENVPAYALYRKLEFQPGRFVQGSEPSRRDSTAWQWPYSA